MLDTGELPVITTVYRNDYQPPAWLVDTIDLRFELGEQQTVVTSTMQLRRNTQAKTPETHIALDGQDIAPESVVLNGATLSPDDYKIEDNQLILSVTAGSASLEITTVIKPQLNTRLMGLYKSGGIFCSQCEAEGFRNITFFPDRPDVLSVYTVTIIADASRYPVLLSNGNRVDSGVYGDGRHWACWHDPFPKPSYLFALVAGKLEKISTSYQTASGRDVGLEIYSEAANIGQCEYAMQALVKSMRWDEQVYGREYDLDVYMIVAVDDFNMGAMENKGLNIFNTKYVLADSHTATDSDFLGVESVIAHEYFHNWSGNRVTCRDWFQLSLKEGFTVFRDQQFSADMHSPGVKRVEDVNVLRTFQFREDAGPMAHPVRPESYQQINNFYTLTVYNKGAEVVRMLSTIVGAEGFRKGSDLYFQRHDGEAVTIEEFVGAMEDANGICLEQYRRWYSQAGTPRLVISAAYNAEQASLALTIAQSTADSPGQKDKQPFHIPVKIGLLDSQGADMPLASGSDGVDIQPGGHSAVLNLTGEAQEFVFENMPEAPVCSILREFSAPVTIDFDQDESSLSFLMAHDSDSFNRWDAGQRLMTATLLKLIGDVQHERELCLNGVLPEAFRRILAGEIDDPALASLVLTPPGELYLAEQMQVIDPDAIYQARHFLVRRLAELFRDLWMDLYQRLSVGSGEYILDARHIGRRSLRQTCLEYLAALDDKPVWQLARTQYMQSTNMTDRLGAFKALLQTSSPQREGVTEDFYNRYNAYPLVMDKWLAVQATVVGANTLARTRELELSPVFHRKNPNKIRSLIGAFASQNPVCFHAADGAGYAYLADWIIELDGINPQITARLASGFNNWRRYDQKRQALMKSELERIAAEQTLSTDTREIVSKALAG